MKRAVAFLVVLAWLAPGLPAPLPRGAASAQPPDDTFVLGVLRRDGLVLPFAGFDGKFWETKWPVDLRTQELPITLQDVPERWWGKPGPQPSMAHWAEGRKAGTIVLQRPTVIPVMCGTRLWLRSDYTSKEPVPPPARTAAAEGWARSLGRANDRGPASRGADVARVERVGRRAARRVRQG